MDYINRAMADKFSDLIRETIKSNSNSYRINEMEYINGRFKNFADQWINYKDIRGAFEIVNEHRTYYIFLVDWYLDNRYTLVVHAKDVEGALFGSYKYTDLQEIDGYKYLYWRYKPTKRDGRNKERCSLFENEYSKITIHIKLPESSNDIEEFINELLKIVDIRIKVEKSIEGIR